MDFNVRGGDVCHSEPAETQNDALLSQSLSEHLFKNKKNLSCCLLFSILVLLVVPHLNFSLSGKGGSNPF